MIVGFYLLYQVSSGKNSKDVLFQGFQEGLKNVLIFLINCLIKKIKKAIGGNIFLVQSS